jgi:hypothetical protein
MLRGALLTYELPEPANFASPPKFVPASAPEVGQGGEGGVGQGGEGGQGGLGGQGVGRAEREGAIPKQQQGGSTPASGTVSELRLYVRLLPLRCHLDEDVIAFAKGIAASAAEQAQVQQAACDASTGETQTQTQTLTGRSPYFQSVMMGATDVKIDYRPGTLSVAALRQGDYLQLLNIFPPDGLELTLAQVQLRGICGFQGVGDALLGLWVRDVYANQLHRVVSGTAPFRGLSNIGAEFQQLMAIPMK